MHMFDFDQVKALGAPFAKAEVHVGLRNKTIRLVLLVPGRKGTRICWERHSPDCDRLAG
jgi:hypothetical protein